MNTVGTTAFVTNNGSNTVTQCTVSGNILSACGDSGASGLNGPVGIVLNTAGTTAFVTNLANNTVTQCTVSGSALSACGNSTASGLIGPVGIVLFP